MSEEQPSFHQKPWVRLVALLLLPAVVIALYVFTTRLALKRDTSLPATPDVPASSN